jgi:SAM-dependent methyltransferase
MEPFPTGDLPELLEELAEVLACPGCGGKLAFLERSAACAECETRFAIEKGIPLLFCPNDWEEGKEDATDLVRDFYERDPFPKYDDVDSRKSLEEKARRGVFARLLDEQIPDDWVCLEAGCGTGQLTNFLGMSHRHRFIGADLCLNSLSLAKGFRDQFRINNAAFIQMNLFRPPFRDGAFDLILSNGVLHHTSDPYRGFRSLLRKLKPGGVVIVGLYNRFGHLPTLWRRWIFEHFGRRSHFLDSRLRSDGKNLERKRSWFRDQYEHPQESRHSYTEILHWFDENSVDFLMGIPKPDGGAFTQDEVLFAAHGPGSRYERWLTEVRMLLSGGRDSGLFMMVGRKR